MDYGTFTEQFPEFAASELQAVVEAHLADAEFACPVSVWGAGALRDLGVKLRAADELAKSPFARPMKLVLQNGKTAYGVRLEQLKRRVALTSRVL